MAFTLALNREFGMCDPVHKLGSVWLPNHIAASEVAYQSYHPQNSFGGQVFLTWLPQFVEERVRARLQWRYPRRWGVLQQPRYLNMTCLSRTVLLQGLLILHCMYNCWTGFKRKTGVGTTFLAE